MRRQFVFLLIAAGAGAAYACSFPDVEFSGVDGGPTADAPGTTTSTSSSSGSTSSSSSGSTPGEIIDAGEITIVLDGAAFDANFDAGGKVDAAAGCATCDCDGDGFLNNDAGCNPPAGQLDCDDFDSRTHPNAGPYQFDAEAPRFGDWNCVNGVEKLPEDNFDCSTKSPTVLLGGCKNYAGFVGTVGCGQKGTYVTCKDPTLTLGNCVTDKIGTATQLCQ